MIEWKDIIGFESYYQISNTGLVKGLKRKIYHSKKDFIIIPEIELKQSISTSGYKIICLQKGGKKKTKYIHRLVGLHFILNPFNKRTLNHIDGNKFNNTVSNLEWATYSENMRHARDKGLSKCTLQIKDIKEIRKLIIQGVSDTEIGIMFNVTRMNISMIRREVTWKNI